MKWPWTKPKRDPGEPVIKHLAWQDALHSKCEFCWKGQVAYEFDGREFCSRWCINYYILNEHKMPTICHGCGWRGADVDFEGYWRKDGTCVALCTRPHYTEGPGTRVLVEPCWSGVSDEEFDEYRNKLLREIISTRKYVKGTTGRGAS